MDELTKDAINRELIKSRRKFPNWSTDHFSAAGLIKSPVGELLSASLRLVYESGYPSQFRYAAI